MNSQESNAGLTMEEIIKKSEVERARLQKIKQDKVKKVNEINQFVQKFDPFVTVSGSETIRQREHYMKITSAQATKRISHIKSPKSFQIDFLQNLKNYDESFFQVVPDD